MRKAVSLYRRDGLFPVISGIHARLRSARVRQRYGYPEGFLVDPSTAWLTGQYARVGRNFRSGKRCRIETIDAHNGRSFTPSLEIGDNVSMNDDVHIGCACRVQIGHNVLMASKIFISDHNHGSYRGERQDPPELAPGARTLEAAPVVIEDDVWIGEMVSILPGVTIGRGSIIGANSVVSRDIPPFSIAVGAPARVVKIFDSMAGRWEIVSVTRI